MKKIITHINPDTDGIISAWLIKKFLPASPAGGPGWKDAEIGFAQANEETNQKAQVDDPNTLFVDVGRGRLDHHQASDIVSAASLCWEYIKQNRAEQPLKELDVKAITELVNIETEVDNTRDLHWPEVSELRTAFYFQNIIESLRGLAETDEEVMAVGLRLTEAIFLNLQNKIKAREELTTGTQFATPWGKGIGIQTGNKYVGWEGEVAGFSVVIQKDPQKGGVRIYSCWDSGADLTGVYNKVRELDPESDWFLPAGKKFLLNQASVNKGMRPTKLSLEQLIQVFENLKGE